MPMGTAVVGACVASPKGNKLKPPNCDLLQGRGGGEREEGRSGDGTQSSLMSKKVGLQERITQNLKERKGERVPKRKGKKFGALLGEGDPGAQKKGLNMG